MPKSPVTAVCLVLAGALFLPRAVSAAPAAPAPAALAGPGPDNLPTVQLSEDDELARLHALPASHIPLKGATLASAIRLLAESAQMSYLAPPDADFTQRVTSDVMMNPFEMLQVLGENYNFGIEYADGIWRFYRINLNELVTKTYTLRFNNLQQVSISSTSINSQLAAFSGGGGGGGSPGGLSAGGKGSFDTKTGKVIEDIKKILGIPTVGLTTPSLDGSPATPGADAAEGSREAPRIEPIWNPDTSQLFVVATRQQHSLIAAYLKTVDQPQKLVRISVKFVETSRNPQSTFGVDWSQTFLGSGGPIVLSGPASTSTTTTSTTATTNTPTPLSTPVNLNHISQTQLPSALLSAPAFQLTLQAIASDQSSTVVQDPVIFTSNNREVTFKATTEEPIQEGSTTFGTATAATTSQIAYIEVGTELTVLPSVLPGTGQHKEIVLLNLSINVSTIVGQQIINGNPYPVTSTRAYSYSVPIPNGETLAIAGLEQRTHQTSDTKVPILGDIPLLGHLFKSNNDQVQHSTLLAFITPEVVPDDRLNETMDPVHLPRLQHRVFQGSATETLAEVDQSLDGLSEDIAALQSCANRDNRDAVLNRLDRIGVELALMDVRLGELSLENNRVTSGESAKVDADREQLSAVRARVAEISIR
jgi:type II secretory pathway component GspD/PulD (secretin)